MQSGENELPIFTEHAGLFNIYFKCSMFLCFALNIACSAYVAVSRL